MNTAPIVPARLERDADGTPWSAEFGDVYHPRSGAMAQARQVFLAGNEVAARWRGSDRFVILETGFGLGNNFLATWAAWRNDGERCSRLDFIAIEARPLSRGDLGAVERDAEVLPLAAELVAAWPQLTCNLHRLSFDSGRVQLLLCFGDVAAWLPQIEATVDAFYLDGFAPARNPGMWQPRLFKAMARIAAPAATVATWTAARPVRDALRAAGFEPRSAPGSGGKREITLARFTPRFAPGRTPRQLACLAAPASPARESERIVIVGGGLAGCAAAWALAGQGRATLLLERRSATATEGSGNAAGLFHGVVHAFDGRHARFNRAAALEAQGIVALAIGEHGVAGSSEGLLRLEPRQASAAEMQATILRLGLPQGYVRGVSASEAGELAGVRIGAPAWHYPGGGWVDPQGLARAYLARAGEHVELRLDAEVAALRRSGERWILLDAAGSVLATAAAVVLANAGGASELLGAEAWPMARVRGQASSIAAVRWPTSLLPRIPIAGSGYLVPAVGATIWFGATSQIDDADPAVREHDHWENLDRLAGLLAEPPRLEAGELGGRTGFRWLSGDRLPIVGAVAAGASLAARLGLAGETLTPRRPEQARFAPRLPGLFVFTALGSRGIAWSALGAQALASSITGAPAPVESDLLDALDPARFASRAFRRGAVAPA